MPDVFTGIFAELARMIDRKNIVFNEIALKSKDISLVVFLLAIILVK